MNKLGSEQLANLVVLFLLVMLLGGLVMALAQWNPYWLILTGIAVAVFMAG